MGYPPPAIGDLLDAPATTAEVAMLRRLAGLTHGRGPWRWFEPACGTGRLLRALAADGAAARAVGVELDPRMVRAARRAPGGEGGAVVQAGDMRRIDPARTGAGFDLAFCLDNSIRHLQTDADLAAHLRGVRRVLEPARGVYLVGVSLLPAALRMESESIRHAAGRSADGRRIEVRQAATYTPVPRGRDDGLERCTLVTHVRRAAGDGRGWRARVLLGGYDLRCLGAARWARLVARSGFAERAVLDEEGRPLDPAWAGYAIRVLGRRGQG